MIEVVPCNLARGIQLVGFSGVSERRVPSCALVGILTFENRSCARVKGVWLDPGRDENLPMAAVRDLVLEVISPLRGKGASSRCCPVCGRTAEGMAMTTEGRPICMSHLGDILERTAKAWFPSLGGALCPQCGRFVAFLWSEEGLLLCSHCLCSALPEGQSQMRWLFTALSPLPPEMEGDLRIFREAWRWISVCLRCGCADIRIRRIFLDLPKAAGPIYPLWEIDRRDRNPGAELRRWRQLQIYTQGFMRVTLECPMCGYLERELPGVGLG